MQETRYAYGYVRVSDSSQEELSPDSQEKLLKEFAIKNNIVILKTFFELGVSGRKASKRPEFQSMIAAAKSSDHPVDVILVWKFSRFARNQEESIVYKSLLKKQHNVDVVSVSEPLIDGPFGSLIERIIEWMDEYYSIRLSSEVTRGMKEKAIREGYQISPPLGYQAIGNGKPFVINEEKYKIVSYIFDQYDYHHMDPTRIARNLNEMGCRTQRKNLFEARSIVRILKNPFYYGLVTWNEISFIGLHEVRLTKERFDERMAKMQALYKPRKRRNVSTCQHWLSGLLRCGYCGGTLAWNGRSGHSPGFQCWQYSKGFHKESCSISEKKMITAVENYLEELLSGKDFEYNYIVPETTEKLSKRDSLLEELEKIASRERRIRLAYENEVDTLEEYKVNKERLKKAREDVQRRIDEMEEPSEDERPSKDVILKQVEAAYNIIKNPEIDSETKGYFMRRLFKSITYDKENGEMIFDLYFSQTQ